MLGVQAPIWQLTEPIWQLTDGVDMNQEGEDQMEEEGDIVAALLELAQWERVSEVEIE